MKYYKLKLISADSNINNGNGNGNASNVNSDNEKANDVRTENSPIHGNLCFDLKSLNSKKCFKKYLLKSLRTT